MAKQEVKIGLEYKFEKPLEETILYDKVEPAIVRITLNRPEKHNAMIPPDSFRYLGELFGKAVDDPDVKVIILRGAGPSFCTGDDLNRAPYEGYGAKVGFKPPQSVRVLGIHHLYEFERSNIMFCPKVTIAQVHGNVDGEGMHIMSYCDLAIAGESTNIHFRGGRLGFGCLDPATMHLMFTVGLKREFELCVTGRDFKAQEAKEWGIVNAVVPDDKLDEEALRWARAVAAHTMDGLTIGKMYRNILHEMLGFGAAESAWYMAHALFTNMQIRPDEFNFLKARITEGSARKAFAAREARWRQYGF